MNQLTTRTTAVFATAMIAMIILGFAAVMTVSAQTEPERPTDLVATAVDHGTVSLTWSHPDPASVDHYQVLSRTVGASTGLSQVGTATTTSFEHDGLEPESTYIYRVKPVNSAGEEGQRSARAEATTPADDTPAPPANPTPEPEPTPAGPEHSDQRNTRGSHATAHVSNIGQASNSSAFTINTTISQAQGFTTGSQSGGYPFSTVGMQFTGGSATASGLVIAIYSAAAGGGPDSAVYTLTNPSRLERDGTTESLFTAPPNSTLSAGTTYFVVATASGAFTVQVTDETDEDSGASTGWSIADKRHFRNISVNNDWSESAAKLKIGIYPPSTTTLSTDATLSDLELEDNTNTDITLTPSFVSGTTTYTAQVVNSVDEITITPSVNDSTASYEIQNSAGTALTDADTNTTGFQADLSEGANIINVEVTAEDASTETYTVTVTRTPADCETDDIWCATLTVGTHTTGGLTFYGYSVGLGDTTGTLSPNTFTYRAATIGVLALKYDSGATGTLRWGISLLSGTTPTDGVLGDDDFTLHVGTHTFAIDAPGTTTTFTFPDHGLSWTVGDTVTVRLVKNPSSDVTLSTLVVNDGTDDLSPDPAFDPATLGYSVEVDHDVDEVTVTPTLNDTSASYEIQDDEGAALTDVDTTQDDFQVSISPGPNTINVVITGVDGHTTQTYKVTVQRINILVSNIDQTTAVATAVGNNGATQIKHAQKFTTGSNTSGYTLYDVKVFLASTASSEPIVTVNTADGNNPGTLLYNLTAKDSSLTLEGPRRFTANAGATLDVSTSYFIVVANGNTTNSIQARYNLYLTDSNAEDSTGLSDWSITNSGRTGNPNWSAESNNRAFNIQVRGIVTPASTDATLSTLVLQDASDDSVLTLDPTFASGTLGYAASVARGVDEITIIPTPNDTDADYEVQDGDGAALTDADTTQDEFQVSIARGLNAIQIEVTAEDDTTTQTYTVTVTRPRILVSSTGQTSGGTATTGNNSGSQHRHAQKFTTGSNPAGYTLDQVRIHLGTNGNAAEPVITVNSGSGNNPGAVLYTMTNPATIRDSATNTFTAPSGATLEADTSYFVVMENSNTDNDPNAPYQVGLTTSDGEDSSGLSDWDIDDTGRTGTPGWSATSGNVAFRIQVRGTVNVGTPAALPELSFQSDNIRVDEDDSQATVSVLLSQASADTVTVDYATSDDTAEAGNDYTAASGTLTFAPGETVKAIIVPILDDAIYETLERFSVTLSNPTGATLPTFPGARINIALDESPPTASIDDATVDEGAGTMTLTLNLSHESSRNTAYRTLTSDVAGTATQGSDYENFISGGEARITVPEGDTQASLDITITDDAAAESRETITIDWEHDPTGGNGAATPNIISFTGAITDNDDSADATLNTLVVNDGTNNLTLTPRFTSGTYAYAAEVDHDIATVTLTTIPNQTETAVSAVTLDGTAIADSDFSDSITVPSLLVGENEIVVTITAEDGSTQTYTVTVTRATVATPTLSISVDKTTAAFKQDSMTYTLTRTGSTTAALPVSVTLTQTKNFLAPADLTKSVTIAVGQSTETFTVAASSFQSFTAGTMVDGGTLIATVQDATNYDLGTPSSVAVNIVIETTVRIELASYSVAEAAGTLGVKLIARTSAGAPRPSATTSSLHFGTVDGTAINATDFVFHSVGTDFVSSDFSLTDEVWQAEESFNIAIMNDDLDEDDETFTLELYYQVGHQNTPIVDASGNSCGTKCEVTVTIVDNDTAGVTVSKSALTVTEEDTTGDTYTVVLDSQPTADVRIEIGWHFNSDVSVVPHIMTFTPTNWATAQTATVTAGHDADTTNDTDSLIHLAVSTDTNYSSITIAGVAVTVNDNDDATLSALVLQDASDNSVLTLDPTFDAATLEYAATVADGVDEITIIPTLNDTGASYEIQDGDGTALTDADTSQDDFQVSVSRGLSTIQIEVTAEDDLTTQTYTVTMNRPQVLVSNINKSTLSSQNVGNSGGTQTKIAQKFTTGDNAGGYTVDSVSIYLNRAGNNATPVLTINTSDGADPGTVIYMLINPGNINSGQIGFAAPAGATLDAETAYFIVIANSNTTDSNSARYEVDNTDSNAEDNSTLPNWSIANVGRINSGTWIPTTGDGANKIQVRGRISVDAPTLPALSFQPINITVDEDGSQAALAVELSQTSTDTVTVDYATSDSSALAGDDYTTTSGTLTFAPGETVMAIIVPILDDATYEPTQQFDVTLSNPTGATLPPYPGAAINIRDDESPPTASIDDVTVGEDAGTMTLTLNLSHESSHRTAYRTVTSDVGGTATQGADYVNFISGAEAIITVPAGDTQASLDISITDDADAESSETITIRWRIEVINNAGEATPNTIDFTGTITDNDSETNPVTTLVRNTTETSNSSSNGTHAQSFRTGTNATGYTITEVRLRLGVDVPGNNQTAAKISEDDGVEPGNVVATLTNPSSLLPEALNTFTAPAGTTLDPNETYWIVVNDGLTITNTWQYAFASGNDETGETGWEIGNDRLRRTSGTNWSTSTSSLIMAIKGQINYPNLSIIDASATEGDDIVFTVNLSGTSADDVTFKYDTSRKSDDNSEAIDFTHTEGTGTITAGSTSTTITVPTDDDGLNNDTTSTYEGDETFTVTISNPTVAGISQATAKGTILDDERLPTVKFIANNRVTAEHTGSIIDFIEFSVVPKGEQSAQVSLTIAGTATRNDDYTITSTTLTVSANQSQFGTQITLLNDNVAEVTETVIITIVAASTNIQVDPDFSTRTLTIQDDDEHPTVGFTSESFDVDEDAGNAILTVNKTGLSDFPVHVEYETVSRDNAVAGDDYVATSGTLTFQPNETSKTISVPIIDNNVYQINDKIFDVDLDLSSLSPHGTDPILEPDNTVVSIASEDPVPTASMADVTANERAGTMTVTLRLSHPSAEDIQYFANDHAVTGTATRDEDYVDFIPELQEYITVSAGQLSGRFDITLIDDGLEEEDENIHIRWVRRAASMVNPQYVDFIGTITDPPVCDTLGNLENTIIVMNLTGEITQPGQSKFHRIKLDPYRSYMIEAIGQNGEDMLGVEQHPNLTLSNPDIPAIWNAKATSRWITYGDRNDGNQAKNVIRRFLDSDYRTYKVEVNSGNNGTGTYQLKVRVNNICRLDENDNAHYQWAGGPLGYPKGSDLPAGIGGRQVLLTGTDWGNNNITRPEMHHVLGDNWNSNRDEDWIGVDLENGEEYTVRLRTKNSLPERLQATGLKILGIYDSNGNAIGGTASAGAAGKKVFVTDWTAPSTGRFHIAVGSEGNDRTGTYWLSIIKDATN